jgi:RND family efflux transporter MFP subunit
MTLRRALLLALAFLPLVIATPARSEPSALVQLTKLQKGSLPQVVTAYGTAQANMAARQTLMAPLSAVVDAVYVRQGEEVGKNAPLIRLDPSPTTAASFTQAKFALRVASELLQRTRTMVRQHLATEQQLADAQKSESDARSNLAALQAQGAGAVSTLRAPFPAIITALSTSPGAIVAQGSPLLELDQPQRLILRVGVIPAQAAMIAPGDRARVTPLGRHESDSGAVQLRGSVVDPATGLVPVDITLPVKKFLPGQMAKADITTGEVHGYVVPHEAILVNDRGDPYVVQAVNMVAKKVSVRILVSDGDKDVIAGPLDEAAPIVLTGNYQLDNGMKVRVAQPSRKSAQ